MHARPTEGRLQYFTYTVYWKLEICSLNRAGHTSSYSVYSRHVRVVTVAVKTNGMMQYVQYREKLQVLLRRFYDDLGAIPTWK
jgi:hypothetical protein